MARDIVAQASEWVARAKHDLQDDGETAAPREQVGAEEGEVALRLLSELVGWMADRKGEETKESKQAAHLVLSASALILYQHTGKAAVACASAVSFLVDRGIGLFGKDAVMAASLIALAVCNFRDARESAFMVDDRAMEKWVLTASARLQELESASERQEIQTEWRPQLSASVRWLERKQLNRSLLARIRDGSIARRRSDGQVDVVFVGWLGVLFALFIYVFFVGVAALHSSNQTRGGLSTEDLLTRGAPFLLLVGYMLKKSSGASQTNYARDRQFLRLLSQNVLLSLHPDK